jgi:CubicO group peptidase (beta-lactamase class C family)
VTHVFPPRLLQAILVLPLVGCFLPIASSAQDAPDRIPEGELIRQANALVDSLAAREAFSGVVMLGRGGEPVWERAVGWADREGERPNRTETFFNIGSINKVFTLIAIRQLAAAGHLDLDAPLAAVWPDYPNAEVARRVSVRQLLNHTSGIGGNIFGVPAGGQRSDLRHNRDFLSLFVDEPLQFDPGQGQQYSNAGYVVLGLLVERLSGQDYYDFVRDHIYRPAGMGSTAHYPLDALPDDAAIGYVRSDEPVASDVDGTGAWRPNTPILPGRGSAAGGGYSTGRDLLRFVQALREGRIPQGPPPGLGVAGGAPGLNAAVEGELPGGYDLVVLSNLSPPAAQRLAGRIRGLLGAEG